MCAGSKAPCYAAASWRLLHGATKRSYTQLDSKKQVTAFWNREITIHKGSSTPTKMSKLNSRQIHSNVKNFDEIHVLSARKIGPANNTTRCSELSRFRLH